jgi:OOP family OmpA-OmpF porin
MRFVRTTLALVSLLALGACAGPISRDAQQLCMWGGAVAGAAVGAVAGNLPGAAGGAAGGAILGSFVCGPVGEAPAPEPAPRPAAELDSDGDGVPDSRDWCAGTPRGVAVDERGCPRDSDGDGVPDERDQCPDTKRGVTVDENGCPERGQVLFVLDDVHFAFDSATLSDSARSVLEEAVTTLQRNPSISLSIEGHTDSVGSDAYNQKLSERRAQAVADFLISRGIPASRLSVVGHGESRPIADNSTADGRARNRRVEFVVR